jgi:hypothetical protein
MPINQLAPASGGSQTITFIMPQILNNYTGSADIFISTNGGISYYDTNLKFNLLGYCSPGFIYNY